ncbi:MAG: hypothetical protein H0T46_35280 [Deltaproteobacteria bacterium]|nr:hypothetical protein [Deltaproteobacteria bacterium]
MASSIDVACISAANNTLDDVVPDPYGVTERTVSFEAATSVAPEHAELCVAKLGDWFVVLDPGARLIDSRDYAREVSANGDAYLFRISDQPIAEHFRTGKPQPIPGGGTASWGMMRELTGITAEALQGATFTVLEMD